MRQRETGQAMVEASLILPMMIFFVLGTIQLGMMHQAKLMTEYAAYRAVRAGIVNNGNCESMKKAAAVALLPTFGQTLVRSGVNAAKTGLATFQGASNTVQAMRTAFAQNTGALNVVPACNLTRIQITQQWESGNQSQSAATQIFNQYGGHLSRNELDYDDIRDDIIKRANLLSIEVTYNYKMLIPFANRLIHSWFMGASRLKDTSGLQFENQTIGGQGAFSILEAEGNARGYAAQAQCARAGQYFIPLKATYTMRMQSNYYRTGLCPMAPRS